MSKDKSDFQRQRRNLIITSLFIIFYETADLKITEINFLGNNTTIGNPEIVSHCLVILFLYFLWRYYTANKYINGYVLFLSNLRKFIRDNSFYKAKRITTKKIGLPYDNNYCLDYKNDSKYELKKNEWNIQFSSRRSFQKK